MPKMGQQRGTPQRRADFIVSLRLLGEGEECVYWPWSDIRGQYVSAHIDGQMVRVHRWVYEQINGVRLSRGSVVPGDQVVMHKCDNPACCRPSHLVLGTPQQNIQDAADKGRLRGRVGNGIQTKVATDHVPIIRELASEGVPRSVLARAYRVSVSTIGDIVTHRSRTGTPHRKLSAQDYAEIRRLAAIPGTRQTHLAKAFGVSDATISHIVHGYRR